MKSPQVYCQETEFNERLCSLLSAVLSNPIDRTIFTDAILQKARRLKEEPQRRRVGRFFHNTCPLDVDRRSAAVSTFSCNCIIEVVMVVDVIGASTNGHSVSTARVISKLIALLWHAPVDGCSIEISIVGADSILNELASKGAAASWAHGEHRKRIFVSFGSALRGVYDYLRDLDEMVAAEAASRQTDRICRSASEKSYAGIYFGVLGVVAVDPPARLVDSASMIHSRVAPLPFLFLLWCGHQMGSMIQRLVRNPYSVIAVIQPVRDDDNNGKPGNISLLDSLPTHQSVEFPHFQVWLARTIVKYIGAVSAMAQEQDNSLQSTVKQHQWGVLQKSKL